VSAKATPANATTIGPFQFILGGILCFMFPMPKFEQIGCFPVRWVCRENRLLHPILAYPQGATCILKALQTLSLTKVFIESTHEANFNDDVSFHCCSWGHACRRSLGSSGFVFGCDQFCRGDWGRLGCCFRGRAGIDTQHTDAPRR
jgi:hypothetical protein